LPEDEAMKFYLRAQVILLSVTVATATAIAAEPGPTCAPILKAMARTIAVDHASVSESNGHTSKGLTVGGVNYLQIDGVWKVSGMSPKDNQTRSDENLKNAKSYTCQSLPDSTIDGVVVANYQTRTEIEDTVVESKIALSKATGLAIQVDNNIGEGKKSHYSTRYSYTNIHAPTVQK
jgi:hypothetical protein